MSNYDKVLEVAAMFNMADDKLDEALFQQKLDALTPVESRLSWAASKLLSGERFSFSTDNPSSEVTREMRALAEYMGATFEEIEPSKITATLNPGALRFGLTPRQAS